MKHLMLLLFFPIIICSCNQMPPGENERSEIDTNQIESEILAKGKSVVWALNEGNTDTLLRDYWRSDSAKFLINGRVIRGYDEIGNRFTESLKHRKNLELNVLDEQVDVLSPVSAMHIVEFDQIITDLQDSSSSYKGAWTAVYKKINGAWKVTLVHESFHPTDIEN